MGSDRGLTPVPPRGDDFWKLLPRGLDADQARRVVATAARLVADQLGAEVPTVFAGVEPIVGDLAWAQHLRDGPASWRSPELLGAVWERLIAPRDRRGRGAHFTPPEVAMVVSTLAVDGWFAAGGHDDGDAPSVPIVWDPAAGGGAFVLAAARLIEQRCGVERAEIVGRCRVSDIDPVAIEVCDAALELWCGGAARPITHVGDTLLDPAPWTTPADIILGNPPFLGQLSSTTSRDEQRAHALRERFPDVAVGYVDDAGLFVHHAAATSAAGAVVAMIVPASLLGAADAAPVREALRRSGSLDVVWVEEEQSFEAAVDVVALVWSHRVSDGTSTRIVVGARELEPMPTPSPSSWAPLLAGAGGVPQVDLEPTWGVLGDVAEATAGFRQHFYGIADAVVEHDNAPTSSMSLVTAGAIDPLWLRWGTVSVRFAGRRWDRPCLDPARITDARVAAWFMARARPKLLLASQTRVVEAVVDTTGSLAPSVPVISVEPFPDESGDDRPSLWHLAAALSAPAVSAWLVGRAAGTGLSNRAIRVRASELLRVPLPRPGADWDSAASAAHDAVAAAENGEAAAYASALHRLGHATDRAYGVDASVGGWWWSQLRLPPESEPGAY